MTFIEILLVGCAIASMSMTITKSIIMEYPRNQISRLGVGAREFIHCPYCVSHWLAFIFVACLTGVMPFTQFILLSFALVGVASLVSLGIAHLFLTLDEIDSEEEIDDEI
jgi:hypothetical protein